jgi:NADP-dependent 3-hydroxy acid dehydrogenase YdfG
MKLQPRPAIVGKVALVTGASSGIGEATARALAQAGATVVLAARRANRLQSLADEINEAGGEALPLPTDLTQRDQITHLVQETLDQFGRIDLLVNIAGWGRYDWFEEFTSQDLREQYEVNVLGLAELTRQVIPAMKRQRSGHILNMSSYASRISIPPLTVYASTKYAIEGLSDGLRRELAPWGIRVTRIHPSGVPGTEFNLRAAKKGGIRYRSFPLGRVGKERLAQMIVELVEKPRPELFVSRLYDVPVFFNRSWPGLVDFIAGVWVRSKRAKELGHAEARSSRQWFVRPLAMLSILALAVLILTGPRQRKIGLDFLRAGPGEIPRL